MIAWVIGMSAAIIICSLHYIINERPYEGDPLEPLEPFVVSEYYDRMEKAALDILEHQEPVNQTIILWWGLDGLRLNEDGDLKWISRKKLKPVNQSVFYQTCQSIQPVTAMRAQVEQGIPVEARMQIAALQYPAGYLPQMQSALVSSLTQCCCNWTYARSTMDRLL